MKGDYTNFATKEEHDPVYRVKRVSNFVSDGQGNIVREMAEGFQIGSYDYISLAQDTLTDTWTYKTGGSGGTTVATVTVTYTDSGKGTIASVAKT